MVGNLFIFSTVNNDYKCVVNIVLTAGVELITLRVQLICVF